MKKDLEELYQSLVAIDGERAGRIGGSWFYSVQLNLDLCMCIRYQVLTQVLTHARSYGLDEVFPPKDHVWDNPGMFRGGMTGLWEL